MTEWQGNIMRRFTYGGLPLTVSNHPKQSQPGRLGEGSERINIKTASGSIN